MKYLRDYIENSIRNEHEKAQIAWDAKAYKIGSPRLHPSSLGGCPRAAILKAVQPFLKHSLHQPITHPFELYIQTVMMSGNVWENVIGNGLIAELPGLHRNVRSHNDIWAWELDGLIEPELSPEFPEGLIVEIKDTAEYNFKSKDRLPYLHHCCQVLAYQTLMEAKTGHHYPVRIYYNGRGQWAEYDIRSTSYEGPEWRTIEWHGRRNDYEVDGAYEHDIYAEMQALTTYWEMQALPQKYSSPFEKSFGCVRGSDKKSWYPNCQYFSNCWPGMPDGPFSKDVFT